MIPDYETITRYDPDQLHKMLGLAKDEFQSLAAIDQAKKLKALGPRDYMDVGFAEIGP